MSHYRKNTFLNEQLDEKKQKEESDKKSEYQKILLAQIEEQSKKKKEQKEAKKNQEMQELQKAQVEEQFRDSRPKKFKNFAIETKNPFAPTENPCITKVEPNSENKKRAIGSITQNDHSFRTNQQENANFLKTEELPPKNRDSFNIEKFSSPNNPSKMTDQSNIKSSNEQNKIGTNEDHINSETSPFDNYLNRQIETLNVLSNSTKNCINTSLSKNYVLKHKTTNDYNTITDMENGYPPFSHVKNQSRNFMNLNPQIPNFENNKKESIDRENLLLSELSNLKKSSIVLSNETDELKLELLKLKNEFKRVQRLEQEKSHEIFNQICSTSDERQEQNLIYSYLAMNKSMELNAISDFVSFCNFEKNYGNDLINGDFKQTDSRQIENQTLFKKKNLSTKQPMEANFKQTPQMTRLAKDSQSKYQNQIFENCHKNKENRQNIDMSALFDKLIPNF